MDQNNEDKHRRQTSRTDFGGSDCHTGQLETEVWSLIMFCWLVCGVDEATWPSQRSMSWAFSLLALTSLLCSSLPSKYIQGQQCSQGIGCPHASLANRAMSTPLMNRAASWTPRASRLSICRRETSRLRKCLNDKTKKTVWSPNSPTEHSD